MKKILLGTAIVVLAFFFRFNNLNWDTNFHLHPDERFLTMVGTAMKPPETISQYFDQKTSLLNPANIGSNFFVYGRFPLMLTKYITVIFKLDNYNDLTILGRQLSAFFDLLIVILVYKTTKLLFPSKKNVPFWAAFFYSISVLPIQLSHFFAVDTFLNFFMFASFYFALRIDHDRPLQNTILSAIFFGLALACKITAVFILPLILFFLIKTVLKKTVFIGLFFLVAYLTLRFADPYLFQNSDIFDPTISKNFIENIKSLQNMTVKNIDNWFPPMIQWLNKNTVQHSLVNNIVFGMGIPMALLFIVGIFNFQFSIFNKFSKIKIQIDKNWQLIAINVWLIGFFIYQCFQVTPTLRYFIIIYPFFAIFAAVGIDYLIHYRIRFKGKYITYPKYLSKIFILVSIAILLLWPLMFSSIYLNKNSRVEASEWIYKNLPDGSYILSEAWDDSLPLSVVNNNGKQFDGKQLPVFNADTDEKWQQMNNSFENADYYILSSNRGWGSITTIPEKYPKMSKFYNDLLGGKNEHYIKIKEFSSYPRIHFKFLIFNFQFSIPDQWSDEGFTVYDHPLVLIYKNAQKL